MLSGFSLVHVIFRCFLFHLCRLCSVCFFPKLKPHVSYDSSNCTYPFEYLIPNTGVFLDGRIRIPSMDVEEKLAKSNGILQYENEILLQLYHEDGLLILAR